MKYLRIAVLLLSTLTSVSYAQERPVLFDDNVAQICEWVKTLKENPKNYRNVCRDMAVETYWRFMEEYYENSPDAGNMCALWDDVQKTGLNDTAFEAEKERGTRPLSTDNFCAGNETRYRYSLYECTLLADCCVSTTLNQRNGPQLLLVVPYNPGTVSVEVFLNGNKVSAGITPEGYMSFYIDERVKMSDDIRIDVHNTSSENQSVIVINHNSCR